MFLKNFEIKKVIVIVIIFIFTLLFAFQHFFQKSNFVKNLVLETSDSLTTLIVIKNPVEKPVKFNFSLNNKFYSSINYFIKKNSTSNDSEQLVIDLFNAQISSLVHQNLFNDWKLTPLTTLNSCGFAICGRQSEIFSQILYNAGFSTRIDHLNGHVVSEIYYKNAWHLFDLDRKIFFENDKKILSYKEIIQNHQILEELVTNKYMANLTILSKKYTQYFITEQDNSFIELNSTNRDTFLINIPQNSTFVFPYMPDYRKDVFPYNTKAKLFLPKGFNGVVDNPLILIDVEGKGKIRFNKCEYSIPEEVERLKTAIFKSKTFVKKIHVTAFSDSFALVYMINPLFSKIHRKNNFFINASDSLSVYMIKNSKVENSNIQPTNIELLNKYAPKAFELVKNIKLLNITNIEELYEKQLKSYCLSNNLDTFIVKKRIIFLKDLLNKPIIHYSKDPVFYGVLSIVLYSQKEEFKSLLLFNYKYQKYKKILRKYGFIVNCVN